MEEVAATAPRAAKRVAELTGCEAQTIHRLLEVQWDDGRRAVSPATRKIRWMRTLVVIDEMSIVDMLLFDNLLRALGSPAAA